MQWNEFSHDIQVKVLNHISHSLSDTDSENLQFAIQAAIIELETWSNRPCEVIEEEYVAEASEY